MAPREATMHGHESPTCIISHRGCEFLETSDAGVLPVSLAHLFGPSSRKRQAIDMHYRSRRTVTFDEEVSVRKVDDLDSYTDDEIEACWYSDKEYNRMRKSNKLSTKFLSMPSRGQPSPNHAFAATETKSCDSDICSTRGIESLYAPLSRIRMKSKRAAWNSVLKAQKEPLATPESIADDYRRETTESRMAAYWVGLEDERAVKTIADSPFFMLR